MPPLRRHLQRVCRRQQRLRSRQDGRTIRLHPLRTVHSRLPDQLPSDQVLLRRRQEGRRGSRQDRDLLDEPVGARGARRRLRHGRRRLRRGTDGRAPAPPRRRLRPRHELRRRPYDLRGGCRAHRAHHQSQGSAAPVHELLPRLGPLLRDLPSRDDSAHLLRKEPHRHAGSDRQDLLREEDEPRPEAHRARGGDALHGQEGRDPARR